MTDHEEKSLVPREADSRIAAWGERDEVREIARRVQLMAPGAKRLKDNEALALAQGAVAHGLDPFNGEIWFIPDSGLMAGIKGLRKAARRQIKGNFWPEFEQLTDPDVRRQMMIPDGALAFRCLLRDTETIMAYAESWKALAERGVPADAIPTIIGKRPYVEGVGYLKLGERTKMDPVQCAMKRAEADALKRRFDLPFAAPTGEMEIVDADWSEATVPAPPADVPTSAPAPVAAAAAPADKPAESPPAPAPHVWDEAAVSEAKKLMPADTPVERVVGILNLSPYTPKDPLPKILDWVGIYVRMRPPDKKAKLAAATTAGRATAEHRHQLEAAGDVPVPF